MSYAHLAAAAQAAAAGGPAEVAARGGPSEGTVRQLLSFNPARDQPRRTVHTSTLRAYDVGFGWTPGTAERYYRLVDGPPGLVISDPEQFANFLVRRFATVIAAFAAQIATPESADGAQAPGAPGCGDLPGVAGGERR